MSASSNSRLLDRRGFLRLGAGALATTTAAFEWGYKLTTRACKSVPPNPFVAAGKPLLVVVEGEDMHAMLRAGIEALGGLDPLAKLGSRGDLSRQLRCVAALSSDDRPRIRTGSGRRVEARRPQQDQPF